MYKLGDKILTMSNKLFYTDIHFISGITIYTGGTHDFILPRGCTKIEYLCIAGGGGGGADGTSFNAGGGGAGGMLTGSTLNPKNGIYKINVGAGGNIHTNGNDSYISGNSINVYCYGGGRGSVSNENGGNGGSGGGGGAHAYGGSGVTGQGYKGGDLGGTSNGCGGGGAGGAGGTYGGAGKWCNISGINTYYAKGGNGGWRYGGVPLYYGEGGCSSRAGGVNPAQKGKGGIIILKYI